MKFEKYMIYSFINLEFFIKIDNEYLVENDEKLITGTTYYPSLQNPEYHINPMMGWFRTFITFNSKNLRLLNSNERMLLRLIFLNHLKNNEYFHSNS